MFVPILVISPFPIVREFRIRHFVRRFRAMHVVPNTLVRGILATPPSDLLEVSPEERARVYAMMDDILPVTARREGLLNDADVVKSLQRYDLEHITAPTLCVSVADDQFGTFAAARYTAEHIRGARFIGYSRGGHIFAGHHDHLISEIAKFLDRGDRSLYALRESGVRNEEFETHAQSGAGK